MLYTLNSSAQMPLRRLLQSLSLPKRKAHDNGRTRFNRRYRHTSHPLKLHAVLNAARVTPFKRRQRIECALVQGGNTAFQRTRSDARF